MRNVFLLAIYTILATGCTMNPSKEARIQQLESEMKLAIDRIDELQNEIQMLDSINLRLKTRIIKLEK